MDSLPYHQPLYHNSKGANQGTFHKTNVNVLPSPPTVKPSSSSSLNDLDHITKQNMKDFKADFPDDEDKEQEPEQEQKTISLNSLGNHGLSRFYEYFPALPSILSSMFNPSAKKDSKGSDNINNVGVGGGEGTHASDSGNNEHTFPIARAGNHNIADQDTVFVINTYQS